MQASNTENKIEKLFNSLGIEREYLSSSEL